MPLLSTIFEIEQCGDALVVSPIRGFDALSDEEFTLEVFLLMESIDPSVSAIVVDLSQTSACSSDKLLGPLVMLWKRARRHNGRLAICNLSPHGREVLRRTKLQSVWPICASRTEALQAVSPLGS